MAKGYEFDPGFGPNVLAFQETVNYLYMDINRFKNFSQRKMRFKQFYKKMLEVFYNNFGFYIGCLFWAFYIKNQPEAKILNNPCLGDEYNEEQSIAGPEFMLSFIDLFPKDMSYFGGEKFEFEQDLIKIVSAYKEFLVINQGFVKTEKNTDIKLPENISISDIDEAKKLIDVAIKEGNLADLVNHKKLISIK